MGQEVYFEITDRSDIIRIEPIGWTHSNADHDWDKNWVHAKIAVKGGAFRGQFCCDLMTTEFELFKRELTTVYKTLNGIARFKTLEGQVEIIIQGDGYGHFNANCEAIDDPGSGNKLKMNLTFDQTYIPDLIRQLNNIVKLFPIQGTELKIHNE